MTTRSETEVLGAQEPKKDALVYPQLVVPFFLVVLCLG